MRDHRLRLADPGGPAFWARAAALALALSLPGLPASAGLLTARLAGSLGCAGTLAQGATGPVSLAADCRIDGERQGQGFAEADYGLLRASAALQTVTGPFNTPTNDGLARSEFLGTYVFSGPAPTVVVGLQLDLSGHLKMIENTHAASTSMEIILGGPALRTLRLMDNAGRPPEVEDFLSTGADWHRLFGSQDAQLDISVLPFVVQTHTPVSLSLTLIASGGIIASGSVVSDFGSTLSFNADGPVFLVPDGFSVNGDGVIDNRWIGAPVPEPGTWALLAMGLGLTMGWARRQAST
jgi:hypothetical protein